MASNIDPRDPVYNETLELIRATSDPVSLSNRLEGLSRIAREFTRLELDIPAGLQGSICELQLAVDYAVSERDRGDGDVFKTYREFMNGNVIAID